MKALCIACAAVSVMATVCCGLLVLWVSRLPRFPDRIEARAFIVKNEDGKNRAVFGELGFGAGLYILDKSGKKRIRIVVSEVSDSTSMSFTDKAGKERMDLSVVENGAVSFELFDREGASACLLGSAPSDWKNQFREWRISSVPDELEGSAASFGILRLRDSDDRQVMLMPATAKD